MKSELDDAALRIRREQTARLNCLLLLLDWSGLEIDGFSEHPAINAVDDLGNTALHYAAAMGLSECSDLLIRNQAILTLVNTAQQTPCDMAGANGHMDLADALEARVVDRPGGQQAAADVRRLGCGAGRCARRVLVHCIYTHTTI